MCIFLALNGHNSNSNNRCMKRCTRTVGKPCLCYLVHSHAFYKEWAYISRKCVAIVNHKCVVYLVNNYTKNETHGWKHDAWHGAMVWPHHALVKIGELFPYVVMHAFHKSNHYRGSFMVSRGKSPRLKGSEFPLSFVHEFFLR